jgi:N-acyl-L-homoserine lactone synthetase
VLAAAPFEVRGARDPAERESAFRLRGKVALERGWVKPEALSGGREFDEYDAEALQLLAWADSSPVATARIVLPGDRPLPVERAFLVDLPDPSRTAEIGRVAADPSQRGDREHVLLVALFARGVQLQLEREIRFTVGAVADRLVEIYRELGFGPRPLGDARQVWGERRRPVLFDLLAAVEGFLARYG